MLFPITFALIILKSVHGALYCDGVEVSFNAEGVDITRTYGAGICYNEIEDDSSMFFVCTNTTSTIYQLSFDNAFCDGNPSNIVDFSLVVAYLNGTANITCCSGVVCPYGVKETFRDGCPTTMGPTTTMDPDATTTGPTTTMEPTTTNDDTTTTMDPTTTEEGTTSTAATTMDYTTTTMDPGTTTTTMDPTTTEEPEPDYEVNINIDFVCGGVPGAVLTETLCVNETTIETLTYINSTDCSGIGFLSEVTDGECTDDTFYLVECKQAIDTCGIPLPPLATELDTTTTEGPIVTGDPLDIDCDALQFFNDGASVQPAGYCSSLGDFDKTGSYYPICNSATEMAIEYYAATNDCTGDKTTKTVDELMEILGAAGASFVCCTGNPCPVITGTQYIVTDCSDISTSVEGPYPVTDTVGVCEDNPPLESEKTTKCGDGVVVTTNYTGTGCAADSVGRALEITMTDGLCHDVGKGYYVKFMFGCDEAVNTCPTPSPIDESKAASGIMILFNIMVGIGMFMIN